MNVRGEYGTPSDKLSGSPRVVALLTDVGPYRARRGSGLGHGGLDVIGFDPLSVFSPAAAALAQRAGTSATDVELREAIATANEAVAPLVQQRIAVLRDWKPDRPLTRDQMTTIMTSALGLARTCEQNLTSMINKVPAHWETYLHNDLKILQQAIGDAVHFQALVAEAKEATVVPGFRDWIDHLLSRTEDGTTTIIAISTVIPSWLFMRGLLSALHHAAVAAIHAVVTVIDTAASAASTIADFFKNNAKYLLIGGGILAAIAATTVAVRKLK